MTTSPTIASPAAAGSNPATGRNIYVEGNRYVARFKVTLATTHVAPAANASQRSPAKYPDANASTIPRQINTCAMTLPKILKCTATMDLLSASTP